jgi:L-arabinose isomerase
MIDLHQFEVWFLTGSQHLYGAEALRQVAQHSEEIVRALNSAGTIPVQIVFKPVLTTSEEIHNICLQANAAPNCVGVITWMHTFSPSRNWIAGLSALQKPLAHLHTQYNRDIPWSDIDMDFMNLNQAAHGDREFGFIMSRMRLNRKVIVGHWQDPEVQERISVWARAACAWHDAQGAKLARFGDNMRSVAVTEGDKVEAQLRLGYAVHGYGVGDLVALVKQVSDAEIDQLVKDYEAQYVVTPDLRVGGAQHSSVREAARIEIGLRNFLTAGGFKAFTTTFEDLHGLAQLPGVSAQRLMADGYGFGAEGDWKTSALLRAMKVMTSIADGQVSLEVHPLGIGGKADPARLVFNSQTGPAINVSLMDMGNRFRMVVNTVDVVTPDAPLPKLPVARALWIPRPNFKDALAAWIYAGGAHHTGFSLSVTAEYMEDFAAMAGIEFLRIDETTTIPQFKQELHWNDAYYLMSQRI